MGIEKVDDGFFMLQTVFHPDFTHIIESFTDEEKQQFSDLLDMSITVAIKSIIDCRQKGEIANELDREDEGMGRG